MGAIRRIGENHIPGLSSSDCSPTDGLATAGFGTGLLLLPTAWDVGTDPSPGMPVRSNTEMSSLGDVEVPAMVREGFGDAATPWVGAAAVGGELAGGWAAAWAAGLLL